MRRTWLVVLALFVLFVGASIAAEVSRTKITKQTGGSTGDSVTAAADTSSLLFLDKRTSGCWVVAASDSNTIYTTQVSPNGGTNWFTVDVDTVAAGAAEATADFGTLYAGMSIRVITDMIPAGGADYGTAWVYVQK